MSKIKTKNMKTKIITPEKSQNLGRLLCLSISFIILFTSTVSAQGEKENLNLTIGENERVAIIDTIINNFNEYYVFPDIAKKYENHLRKRLENNAYDNITDLQEFLKELEKDMLSIYPDGHLAISIYDNNRDLGREEGSYEEWWNNYVKNAEFNNFGFHKIERLPGNIGYLDLRFMERPSICYETAVAAMKFLSNSKAIIIDLRKNPGGRSIVQLLISYFFEDHRIHYSTDIDRVKDITRQWWTLTSVPGKRMPYTPLYILTSFDTGSAAEAMAYALKHSGRATLIGDTTAGAAHKTHIHTFPELGISIAIPDGHSINPITGKDWEGIGVIPHITVSSDKALDIAHSLALDSLLKTETDEDIIFKLNWVLKGNDIKNNPIVLDKKLMNEYVGEYGFRTIKLKNNNLYYQRKGLSEFKMTPLSDNLFMLEGLDYFRIQFEKDEKGNVIKLVGIYDDGTKSVSNLTK